MSYPLIGILGGSRSGKDTVAEFINGYLGGVSVAQADPMKRFAKKIFQFTDDQLWGPSDSRNAIDERGAHDWYWADVRARLEEFAPEFFEAWNLLKADWLVGQWPTPKSYALSAYRAYGPIMDHFEDLKKNHRQDFSARIQLQKFGTEFGRALDLNLWSGQALALAKTLLAGASSYYRTEGVAGLLLRSDESIPNWVTITDVRFRNEALSIKALGGLLVKVINPETLGAAQVGVKGHASETELLTIPDTWMDATIVNNKQMGLQYLNDELVPKLLWDLNLEGFWPRDWNHG